MEYLKSLLKQLLYYKQLGEKAMSQLSDEDLFWQYNEESNSIAIIVQHLAGNMKSRFTDFLTSDGEKEWRNRDAEFVPVIHDRKSLEAEWESGWKTVLDTINSLTNADLERIIYIRNEGHTVMEAFNRQLAHYPYHIGQMVFIVKMLKDKDWQSLSIPKNASTSYNAIKFSAEKSRKHFTDEWLDETDQQPKL
jgi:Protein of unknown function (DUF1572)